jgi:hypothetical protein
MRQIFDKPTKVRKAKSGLIKNRKHLSQKGLQENETKKTIS